jgi:UDP-N-acetylglucosamine 2-epimerase (non-hydrolysing)
MERFDAVLEEDAPDLVVVVGDVNSTIACALTSVKRGIPVAHVEAGLRSFDRSMPEEINRMLTDAISDVLLVSEPAGVENLRREGVDEDRIFLTGNVMIDTLLACRERAASSDVRERLGVDAQPYGVVTLHRPANVDDAHGLRSLVEALEDVGGRLPLVFPVHPRTRCRLEDAGVRPGSGLRLVQPLGYLDFLALMEGARLILTDSGGIQEEACILQVPCLTLRENTERPITLEAGMNRLVGTDPERVRSEAFRILDAAPRQGHVPALWDGKAAERIARILWDRYGPAGVQGGGRS